MIDYPDEPSPRIVSEIFRNKYGWEDTWPDEGFFMYDRETIVDDRQFAHHKPEQLWSREDNN